MSGNGTLPGDLARRRYGLLLAYGVLSLPIILMGANAALRVNANSPLSWVSPQSPARAAFEQFCQRFGPGDVVLVGWPGGTIDDPRVTRFAALLRQSPTFRFDDGESVFERVVCGTEIYELLLRPPIDLDEAEAGRRLQGSLLGQDGVTTCVVVVLDPRALPGRARWVELLRATATRHCSVPADDLHLAGPVLDGLEVDRESQASLDRFALPSALAVLGMCLLFLPTWRSALVVFGLSIFCELATLALVHHCGDSLNALLIVLPPLIQTAAVSGGIHLVNYHFSVSDSGGWPAGGQAIRLAWLPCALSAGTTAIGLGSLLVSGLSPIRAFGAYGAAGMVLTTALLLTVIPGLFTLWPRAMLLGWKPPRGSGGADAGPVCRPLPTASADLSPRSGTGDDGCAGLATTPDHPPASAQAIAPGSVVWDRVAGVLCRWPEPIAVLALLVMLGVGWGMTRLETSVRIETLFAPDSRLLQDYAWFEQTLGPLVPIEVVVQCERNCGLTARERLQLVQLLGEELGGLSGNAGTLSAATFCPSLAPLPGVPQARFDRLVEGLLEQHRGLLIDAGYLHVDRRGESWRISGRVRALDSPDYGAFLRRAESRLHELLLQYLTHALPGQTGLLSDGEKPAGRGASGLAATSGIRLTCTGIMPVVQGIQRQLFDDLLNSFLSALAVITLVMIVVQGGVVTGLLSMASNVFPIVLVFGGLGWGGVVIDIGSVLTASIALGIAIDNTLHLLTFFRRELDRGSDRPTALRLAYRHCGNAMLHSTLVCLAGTTVFAGANFLPTQRFALLMLPLLLLALFGDLVLLPALLLSPLGRLFERRSQPIGSGHPSPLPGSP